jgi:hypothetical protein
VVDLEATGHVTSWDDTCRVALFDGAAEVGGDASPDVANRRHVDPVGD